MKILIPGISSTIGALVAAELLEAGHEILGIDRRPWPGAPGAVQMFETDLRKRPAEDVFRKHRPDAVIHLATVTHLASQSEDRYRINLGGTRAVFEYCRTYGVAHCIFVGRHTYYGAAPDSPLYHTEDEPPMSIHAFPELADLVAADLYAATALWRLPSLTTAVLRFVYTLGSTSQGTLASYLRGPRVPTVLGFDPLFQFLHERDMAHAICLALDRKIRGVFNVCGPNPVPLSVAIRETGRSRVPLPEPFLRRVLGRFGLPRISAGALEHIKYPVVVDGSAFRAATGFAHQFDEVQAMHAYRSAFPPPPPRA